MSYKTIECLLQIYLLRVVFLCWCDILSDLLDFNVALTLLIRVKRLLHNAHSCVQCTTVFTSNVPCSAINIATQNNSGGESHEVQLTN